MSEVIQQSKLKCRNKKCKAPIAPVFLSAQNRVLYVDREPVPSGDIVLISPGLLGDKKIRPRGAMASASRRAEGGTFYKAHQCQTP